MVQCTSLDVGGNSHKLGKARLLKGFGELVALQVTSNVPQFFLYLFPVLLDELLLLLICFAQ